MTDLFDWWTAPSLVRSALWQSTLWLGAGLLAARLTQARPGRAHAILLVALVCAVLTPAATWVCATLGWGWFAPPTASPLATNAPELVGDAALPTAGFNTERWFLLAWSLVSAALVTRALVSFGRARKLIASDTLPADHELARRAACVASRLNLRVEPRVRVAPNLATPSIWCWGNEPIVLLPAVDVQTPDSVLCHELAHWKRGDHRSGLFAELVRSLLPWSPFAWLAKQRLSELSERACDAWVIETGENRFDYADALLALAPAGGRLAVAGVPSARSKHGLAGRVRALIESERRAPHTPRAGAPFVAVSALTACLATGGIALAQRAAPAPSPNRLGPVAIPAGLIPAGASVGVYPAALDLGVTLPDVAANGTLWLVNPTTKAVGIERVLAQCGCTTVQGLQPGDQLPPSSALELAVTMTPAPAGESKTKDVTIVLDDGRLLVVPVSLRTADPPAG